MREITWDTTVGDVYIPTLETIRRLDAAGLVAVRGRGDLIIVSYTQKCQYDKAWDDDTRICRGLILRVDRPCPDSQYVTQVVALPWAKFFNVGEYPVPESAIVNVTEKLDGSLIIAFNNNGVWDMATRGSFESDQAAWARQFLPKLQGIPDSLTLLFEAIMPGNRIVVDYGSRAELVLLGVRNRDTGHDWPYNMVAHVGAGWYFPVATTLGRYNIPELLDWAKSLDHTKEGCVIRLEDGSRWKLKGDVYRQLHALVSNISQRSVLETMRDGTYEAYVAAIPEEFRGDIERWHADVELQVASVLASVEHAFADAPKGSRKEFALWVMQHHTVYSSHLFALIDGKPIRPMILKDLIATLPSRTTAPTFSTPTPDL